MTDLTNENRELTKETLKAELNKEFTGKEVTITDSEENWIIAVDKVEVSVKAGKEILSGSETETPKGPNGKPLINQTTISEITNEKITGEDALGNQVVIPAGFKLAQGDNGSGETVKEGIVIEDSERNQYVWIPVSNINHDGSNRIKVNSANEEGVEITLGRYTFDTTTGVQSTTEGTYQYANSYATLVRIGRTPTAEDTEKYYQELTIYRQSNRLRDSSGTNTTARGKKQENNSYNGIQGFIESVRDNKGYYVARYEASYRENGKAGSIPSTSNSAKLSETTAPDSIVSGDLWNFITQADAALACYDLYTSVNSDLMNSYAWDTAIMYIQAMENANYANSHDGNGTLNNTGATEDQKCKIFDMAGNAREFTTEYSTGIQGIDIAAPCTQRGASFKISSNYTSYRIFVNAVYNDRIASFRSILFL